MKQKIEDEKLAEMLKKVYEKNRRYTKSRDVGYMFDNETTVFERLGFVKENGKKLTVEEFKEKFSSIPRKHINYFTAILEDTLKRNFGQRQLKMYKENLIEAYSKMGDTITAQQLEEMNSLNFKKEWKKGKFIDFKEKYEMHLAEQFGDEF